MQAGGTNEFGQPYIYWALHWGRGMTPGKLVLLVLFVLYPCFSFLYWLVIWVRISANLGASRRISAPISAHLGASRPIAADLG